LDLKTGGVSDINGQFSIQLASGEYNIEVSYMGYSSLKQKITIKNKNIKKNFYLSPSAENIPEATVTAESVITKMRKDPEPITIIDSKEIIGRATSIDHLLSKATGVKIRKSGGLGSSSRVNIHGLEGKRVQIFVDGNPVNSPDGSFAIDEIPIDLIERIEIYKGIVPARFGGDGIGGAINIVTREYEDDYVDLSYQRGSYNTNRASWVLKKNFAKPGIEVSTGGFYNYSDNDYEYEHNNELMTRNHDKFQSLVMGAGITFTKLWFDEVYYEIESYSNKKQVQGLLEGITMDIEQAETNANALIHTFILKKENFFIDGLSFDNDFTYLDMNMNLKDIEGELSFFPSNSDDKKDELRNRLNLNYKISDKHKINLNHAFRHADYKPSDPLAMEYADINVEGYPSKLTSSILGLTYETRLFNDRFVNMLGFKLLNAKSSVSASDLYFGIKDDGTLDHNDTTIFSSSYSEAVRYKLTPWLSLKASYQHAVRIPDPSEIFGDGYLVSSNPYLTCEESDNFNFGLFIYSYSFLSFYRFQFEANAFYSDVTGYIEKSFGNVDYRYANLGHIKIKGIDAELKLDVSKNIYLHGNFTWQDVRDAQKKDPDGTINHTYDMRKPHIPWLFSNFGAEYHKEDLLLKNSYFKLFWESSYTHEFFYDWEMTKLNPFRVPTSFTHDAGIEYALKNNRYIFSFEVQNLTDEIVYNNYNIQLMGRAFYVKLRYTFMKSVNQ
jgi:outer membrane receptor protein involved in Fe transport